MLIARKEESEEDSEDTDGNDDGVDWDSKVDNGDDDLMISQNLAPIWLPHWPACQEEGETVNTD